MAKTYRTDPLIYRKWIKLFDESLKRVTEPERKHVINEKRLELMNKISMKGASREILRNILKLVSLHVRQI